MVVKGRGLGLRVNQRRINLSSPRRRIVLKPRLLSQLHSASEVRDAVVIAAASDINYTFKGKIKNMSCNLQAKAN